MLGILGIQVILEEDKSSKTDRPNVLVANYTSVLDHFAIDVVINNIVVSKVTYSLLHACWVIFVMLLLSSADFFQNECFQKILSGTLS